MGRERWPRCFASDMGSSRQPVREPAPERPGATPYPEVPRCAGCGDVIGVYEPAVCLTGDEARVTSRAAEPHVVERLGIPVFHRACWTG